MAVVYWAGQFAGAVFAALLDLGCPAGPGPDPV